jgi:hypothetical protein
MAFSMAMVTGPAPATSKVIVLVIEESTRKVRRLTPA